jgi:hypothetical protein
MRFAQRFTPVHTEPVPRLWVTFACAWLPVFGFVGWLLVQQPPPALRQALALLGLVLFAALFAWLTLRDALATGDLVAGPARTGAIRRRLLLLATMTCLMLGMMVLAPELAMWWLTMHVVVAAGLSLPPLLAAECTAGLVGLALACGWLTTGEFDVRLLTQVGFGAGAIAVRQLTISVGQPRLAREVLSAVGIAVLLDDRVGALPGAVDALLAWSVREGVTNVVRHSRARSCAIRVSAHGDVARVELTDDGRGADHLEHTGHGLAGLPERAAASAGWGVPVRCSTAVSNWSWRRPSSLRQLRVRWDASARAWAAGCAELSAAPRARRRGHRSAAVQPQQRCAPTGSRRSLK